jgi:hypothetical protein
MNYNPTTTVMWRHIAYLLTNVGVNKELKNFNCLKELKKLESKTTTTMAHVEAQCLPFGPKWVLIKRKNGLEIKCKPHTMAQVEAQCLPFGQDGCKSKKQ